MKKFSILVLTLLLAFALAAGVSAADEQIVSVSVEVSAPAAGQAVKDVPMGNTEIDASVAGSSTKLEPHSDFDVLGFSWKEKDTDVTLGGEDLFVSGRMYVLEVEIEIISDFAVTGDTVFTVGGKEASLAQSGEEGKKLTLSAEFLAIPVDFEPKVSLTVEGEKRKEYDGKGITLTALVDELGGISYEYAWYRDMVLVEGAVESSYTVRDVSQSGKYLCTVTARVTDDPTVEPKTTRTASHDIEITPTVVTVQIENAEKNLADPDPKFTYTVLGNTYDPLYGELSRLEGEDIGKYSILIGSLGFAKDKEANYQIIVKQGTLTILDVGELPFSAVANIADLSYISGAKKAKIRASASKGAIPDGAILSFTTASAEARQALSDTLGREVMKSFTVSITSRDGKELSLPKHGTIRLQIPLTEEEAKLDLNTIDAGFYMKKASFVTTQIEENEGVSYIVFEIEETGTVALFQGEAKAASPDKKEPGKDNKDGGSVWLWILIIAVSAVAVGGIAFTVIFTLKNKKAEAKKDPVPVDQDGVKIAPKIKKEAEEKDPLVEALSSNAEEKEKQSQIAEELNEKPPIPTKEKPKNKATTTVVSFEDLED
ncbi:MAG: hypothetical protein IKT50_02160 [Clostridia bacterium]|nr:hypothetical protein [Clostridia bacterium]